MRALIMFLVTAVVLFPLTANATDVSGDQWGTWTRDNSPYNVVGEIRVPPESTLVIEPGIVVNFQGHYKFIVDSLATLLAIGTESDSIYFTTDDSATGWNGIRFDYAHSNSEISYCVLQYGKGGAGESGGAIHCYQSSPTISSNTLRNNSAASGGGIYCFHSTASMRDNTIIGNSATDGGGIYCGWGTPTIVENTITDNEARLFGGGVFLRVCDSAVVCRNIITNNDVAEEGRHGGGIICSGGTGNMVLNNTIVGNSAPWCGGGIAIWSTNEIDVRNNIVVSTPSGYGVCRKRSTIFNAGFSDVWDNLPDNYHPPQPGYGDISADPLFVDPGGGDFHLEWGSPCIDAGDPDSPLDPDGTRADMGAFYFHQGVSFSPEEFTLNLLIETTTEKVLSIHSTCTDTALFYLSSDVGWITFLPESGYIPPDSTSDVSITFDGTGLPLGPNQATIVLYVLEPYQGRYDIPVTAHVFSTDYTCISLTPDSLPITIPPEGGSFSFWAQTFNATDFTYYFDIWIDADLPTRQKYGPIYKRRNFRFKPHYGVAYHLSQNVPGFAPAGEYSYNFKMGVLPDQVDFQDSFTFTKLGTGSSLGPVSVTSWDLVGWGEEFVAYLGQAQGQTAFMPTDYSLSQNYPNPFNATTVIEYALPVESHVKLQVYNIRGQKVATLVNSKQQAGYRSVNWDASGVSSGLYFYRLTAGSKVFSDRMMLLK